MAPSHFLQGGRSWPYLREHDVLSPPAQRDAQEVVDGRRIPQAHRPVLLLLWRPAQHHIPGSLSGDMVLGKSENRKYAVVCPNRAPVPQAQEPRPGRWPHSQKQPDPSSPPHRPSLKRENSTPSPGWREGTVLKAQVPGSQGFILKNLKPPAGAAQWLSVTL